MNLQSDILNTACSLLMDIVDQMYHYRWIYLCMDNECLVFFRNPEKMGFDYISSFCTNPVIIIACLCGGQV